MKFYLLAAACFALLISGCSEYELSKFVEKAPEIQVDPLDHDYGHLAAGSETQEILVNVWNVGNDTLDIDRVFLNNGNANFTIESTYPEKVEPAESFELIIKYDPKTYEVNSEVLSIVSNEGKLLARLGGEDGPGLEIGKFMAPHGLAVDSRGDIYVGEVAYTNWPNSHGDTPKPDHIRTLQKLERVI